MDANTGFDTFGLIGMFGLFGMFLLWWVQLFFHLPHGNNR